MNYKCIKDYRKGFPNSEILVFVRGITYTREQITARMPIHMIPEYFREINNSEESRSMSNSEPTSFNSLLDQIKDTHEKKNHDYGNSFAKSMDEFGMPAAAIRLSDKLNRFKALINSEAQVKDESIEDTLFDMAAYAIMTVEYLKKKKL